MSQTNSYYHSLDDEIRSRRGAHQCTFEYTLEYTQSNLTKYLMRRFVRTSGYVLAKMAYMFPVRLIRSGQLLIPGSRVDIALRCT